MYFTLQLRKELSGLSLCTLKELQAEKKFFLAMYVFLAAWLKGEGDWGRVKILLF